MRTPVLSLWQPWASLIFSRHKLHETRAWPPPSSLVGARLAIHAARREGVVSAELEPLLRAKLPGYPDELPRGALLGTVRVISAYAIDAEVCARIEAARAGHRAFPGAPQGPTKFSDLLAGDWTAGRWAWELDDVQPFPEPVPLRGWQGVWFEHLDERGRVLLPREPSRWSRRPILERP